MSGGDGGVEGALQQHLGEQRLGVDVGALAEQDEAGEGEDEREGEARHVAGLFVIARSEATKQSILLCCGSMDCFASLAMTVVETSHARPLGGRAGRARFSGGGWGASSIA